VVSPLPHGSPLQIENCETRFSSLYSRMVGKPEVIQKRASRKLAGLATTSRLLDPDLQSCRGTCSHYFFGRDSGGTKPDTR
jgi:hypothetical protein